MKDKKFLSFWMEKEKREIIENYAECVYDREVLLERIEKAIDFIKSYNIDFENCKFSEAPISIRELRELLDILNGEEK